MKKSTSRRFRKSWLSSEPTLVLPAVLALSLLLLTGCAGPQGGTAAAMASGNSAAQGQQIRSQQVAPGQVCTLEDDYLFEGVFWYPALDTAEYQGYVLVLQKKGAELPVIDSATGLPKELELLLPDSAQSSDHSGLYLTGHNQEGAVYQAYFVASFQLKKGTPLPKRVLLHFMNERLNKVCAMNLSGIQVTETYQPAQP